MDLLQLEHFLAVAEEGNFTRAAERVCRTQPAVSQSVKKLEDRDLHDLPRQELALGGGPTVRRSGEPVLVGDAAGRA